MSSCIDMDFEMIIGCNFVSIVFWLSCWDWVHRIAPNVLRCTPISYDQYKPRKQVALIQCFMGAIATLFLLLPLVLYMLLTSDSFFETGYKGDDDYILIVALSWGFIVFVSTFHYFYGLTPPRSQSTLQNIAIHLRNIVPFCGFWYFVVASTFDKNAELIVYFRYCVVTIFVGSLFSWYFSFKFVQASLITNKEMRLEVRQFYYVAGAVRHILQWNILLWPPLVFLYRSDSIQNRAGLFSTICVFSIPDCFLTTVAIKCRSYEADRVMPQNESLDYYSVKVSPPPEVGEPGMPQYGEDDLTLWGIKE